MIDPTRLLRSAFLALALLFLAPVGAGGTLLGVEAAQAATVARISVIGNKEVDDAAVIKYLAVRVGEQATSAKLSASVDALQATGLFKSVSVTMQGSTVVVKVVENSIVSSVQFEGNQRFSDANLVAMIDLMNRGTVDQASTATSPPSRRPIPMSATPMSTSPPGWSRPATAAPASSSSSTKAAAAASPPSTSPATIRSARGTSNRSSRRTRRAG